MQPQQQRQQPRRQQRRRQQQQRQQHHEEEEEEEATVDDAELSALAPPTPRIVVCVCTRVRVGVYVTIREGALMGGARELPPHRLRWQRLSCVVGVFVRA